jgi:rsbT antagonist protein RsbS
MACLRGAVAVIVGIQPDVAFAMVTLGKGKGKGKGMGMGAIPTVLDLEEGLALLKHRLSTAKR